MSNYIFTKNSLLIDTKYIIFFEFKSKKLAIQCSENNSSIKCEYQCVHDFNLWPLYQGNNIEEIENLIKVLYLDNNTNCTDGLRAIKNKKDLNIIIEHKQYKRDIEFNLSKLKSINKSQISFKEELNHRKLPSWINFNVNDIKSGSRQRSFIRFPQYRKTETDKIYLRGHFSISEPIKISMPVECVPKYNHHFMYGNCKITVYSNGILDIYPPSLNPTMISLDSVFYFLD